MKNKIMALMAAVLVAGFAAPAAADGAVNTPVVTPAVSTSVAVEAANLYNSGMSYFNGTNGVQRDWIKALEQLTAAAHKGYVLAWKQLIDMYSYGYGTPRDTVQAQYWAGRVQRATGSYSSAIVVNGGTGVSSGGTVSTGGVVDASQDGVSADSVNISTDSFSGGGISSGDAANSTNITYSAD